MRVSRLRELLPFRSFLILANLFLFAIVGAVALWMVMVNAEHRQAAARTHLRVFMKAMDAYVVNTFKESDIALQGFIAEYRALAPTQRHSTALRAILQIQRPAKESDSWILFIDADGRGMAISGEAQVGGVYYGDRDYFRIHTGAVPHKGAFVGEPTVGRATGRRFIPISRRVNDEHGRFAGVIAIAIDANVLARTFQAARLSQHDVISLAHRSGRMVARVPDFEKTFGLDVRYAQYFLAYLAGEKSGTVESVSQIDGIRRVSAWQEVEGLPLVLGAGLPSTLVNEGMLRDAAMAGVVMLIIGLILFVTSRQLLAAHAATARSEARFRQLYTAIRDGVGYVDMRGRLVDVNDEFVKLTGYPREELIGMSLRKLIPAKWHEQEDAVMNEQVLVRGYSEEFDKEYIRRDGSIVAVNVKIWLIRDEQDQPSMMAVVVRDVTKRRALAEKVEYLAQHDALTGLVNRAQLTDRIEQALAHARRRSEFVAVIFIDLDDFKQVNDTWGHAAGDELLKQVANLLVGNLRASDTACRFGGDEFIVVLPDLADPAEASKVVEKIERAAAEGVEWEGKRLAIRFSFGVAIYPDDALEAKDLLQRADSAMYLAKSARRQAREAAARP